MDRATYRSGALAVLPLAAAVLVLGVTFGALAVSAGLTPAAAVAMSATTFAGSAQFAAVGILGAGGAVSTAVVSAALLNARYAAMGAAVAPALHAPLWKRLLIAQLTVDETWAVAWLPGGKVSPERLVGAGLALFAAHVGSTISFLTTQGFLLVMMIVGAIGFYLGIDTPPLPFHDDKLVEPKVDSAEFLTAVGTFLATLAAFASVAVIILRQEPHIAWTVVIMLGWSVGVIMQIIAGAIARARK